MKYLAYQQRVEALGALLSRILSVKSRVEIIPNDAKRATCSILRRVATSAETAGGHIKHVL